MVQLNCESASKLGIFNGIHKFEKRWGASWNSWVSQANHSFSSFLPTVWVKPSPTTPAPKKKKTRCFKEHPEHPTAEEIEDAAPGRGSRTKSVELEMDLATGDRFPARKMGVALDRWMVYFRENFDLKRMRTGALPYDSGNLHFKFSKRLAIQKWWCLIKSEKKPWLLTPG